MTSLGVTGAMGYAGYKNSNTKQIEPYPIEQSVDLPQNDIPKIRPKSRPLPKSELAPDDSPRPVSAPSIKNVPSDIKYIIDSAIAE